jgi:hypothetical protein
MVYWLLYFFVVLGAKLLLALLTIYFLLPAESTCNQCDEDTILLQARAGSRLVSLVCLGTLQRRWCPRCGWEGFARAGERRPLKLLVQADPVVQRSRGR